MFALNAGGWLVRKYRKNKTKKQLREQQTQEHDYFEQAFKLKVQEEQLRSRRAQLEDRLEDLSAPKPSRQPQPHPQHPAPAYTQRESHYIYEEPGQHPVEVMHQELVPVSQAGAIVPANPSRNQLVPPSFYSGGNMPGQYGYGPGGSHPAYIGPAAQMEYPDPSMMTRKKKIKRKKTPWEEFKTILAVVAFIVSIIVKAVAYSSSHWSTADRRDVYKSLEKFPLMTQFLERSNANYLTECSDQRCKTFFTQYNAQRTINDLMGKPPPPLFGTYSRGANSRCETIETGAGSIDSAVLISGYSKASRYEKCAVDKEVDINDFKTVRVCLIVSMVADSIAIISWVVTFIKDASQIQGRIALAVAILFGFISSLLSALVLGLFAQAVDIFSDSYLTLGWPYWLILLAGGLAIFTTVLAAWSLYEGRRREKREEREKAERNYALQEFEQNRSGFEEYKRFMQMQKQRQAIAPPPPRSRNDTIHSTDEELDENLSNSELEMMKKKKGDDKGSRSRDPSPDSNFRRGGRGAFQAI